MVLSCIQSTSNHFALLSKERKKSDNSLIRGVSFVKSAYVTNLKIKRTVFAKIKGWRCLRTRLEGKASLDMSGPSFRQEVEGVDDSATKS